MSTTALPAPPGPAGPSGPVEVLADARAMVAGLGETLWAAAEPALLLGVFEELEQLRSTLAAVTAQVVVEVEASDAPRERGWASVKDYLTHAAGGRKGHGSRVLRTARPLCGDRTLTLAALTDGDISPEQAEVVVRVIDRLPVDEATRSEAERALLDQAAELDASDLARAGDFLLEVIDPDGAAAAQERALSREERSAHLGRFLSISEDGLGGVRLKGRGSTEDAAILKTALQALAAPAPAPVPGTDTATSTGSRTGEATRDLREHGTRMWDALVGLSQHAMDAEVLPDQHGTKPRLAVTITLAELRTALGAATLETGDRLSAEAVRRLACDADLVPAVLGGAGEVLDVGRLHRLVTTALWRALVLRDAHCAFPGCRRQPLACDAHHIVHWAEGGPTSLDNLVLLCRAHHTLLHATPWQARINPDDRLPEFKAPPARPTTTRGPGRSPDPGGWIREMRR